jgi:hypothetical protein
MLDNPHVGQRVRIGAEYRDEWPVQNIGDRPGQIMGVGSSLAVEFDGLLHLVYVPARFLEAVE